MKDRTYDPSSTPTAPDRTPCVRCLWPHHLHAARPPEGATPTPPVSAYTIPDHAMWPCPEFVAPRRRGWLSRLLFGPTP